MVGQRTRRQRRPPPAADAPVLPVVAVESDAWRCRPSQRSTAPRDRCRPLHAAGVRHPGRFDARPHGRPLHPARHALGHGRDIPAARRRGALDRPRPVADAGASWTLRRHCALDSCPACCPRRTSSARRSNWPRTSQPRHLSPASSPRSPCRASSTVSMRRSSGRLSRSR